MPKSLTVDYPENFIDKRNRLNLILEEIYKMSFVDTDDLDVARNAFEILKEMNVAGRYSYAFMIQILSRTKIINLALAISLYEEAIEKDLANTYVNNAMLLCIFKANAADQYISLFYKILDKFLNSDGTEVLYYNYLIGFLANCSYPDVRLALQLLEKSATNDRDHLFAYANTINCVSNKSAPNANIALKLYNSAQLTTFNNVDEHIIKERLHIMCRLVLDALFNEKKYIIAATFHFAKRTTVPFSQETTPTRSHIKLDFHEQNYASTYLELLHIFKTTKKYRCFEIIHGRPHVYGGNAVGLAVHQLLSDLKIPHKETIGNIGATLAWYDPLNYHQKAALKKLTEQFNIKSYALANFIRFATSHDYGDLLTTTTENTMSAAASAASPSEDLTDREIPTRSEPAVVSRTAGSSFFNLIGTFFTQNNVTTEPDLINSEEDESLPLLARLSPRLHMF